MASHILCGRCGAVLDSAGATCRSCGATATGYQPHPPYGYGHAQRPRKNPWAAAALSALIPGMGQIYLGQTWRGLAYLVGTLGLELSGLGFDLTAVGIALGVPMELGGLALWVHGVIDAYVRAKRVS